MAHVIPKPPFVMPWHGRYCIVRNTKTGEYWSNEDGWVDRKSADKFTVNEAQRLKPPIDGEWLYENGVKHEFD